MKLCEPDLLSVKGVGFVFNHPDRQAQILDNVSLSLRRGEFCSIIGRSGVGKSTLLRIIAGQFDPIVGDVQLSDIDHDCLPVLYHPQEALLIPWTSVTQNAEIGLRLTGLVATMPLKSLFGELELLPLMDRHPAQLSGGQIERVALARTLLTPAALYLLDEPLSGTDYPLRIRVETFLAGFVTEQRRAAVMVTHDVPQAVAVSDMIHILAPRAQGAEAFTITLPPALRVLPPIERRASSEFGPFVQHLVDQLGEPIE